MSMKNLFFIRNPEKPAINPSNWISWSISQSWHQVTQLHFLTPGCSNRPITGSHSGTSISKHVSAARKLHVFFSQFLSLRTLPFSPIMLGCSPTHCRLALTHPHLLQNSAFRLLSIRGMLLFKDLFVTCDGLYMSNKSRTECCMLFGNSERMGI